LYFSCKNYQELAQARITKVLGYFTANPTKFVLHFYEFFKIFYVIYKNQQKHKYYFSCNFAVQPSRRNTSLKCGPWGAASGGPAAIPAGDRRMPAGGGWGSELGATRVRFGGSIEG
jgi:hypothetical protein